MNKLLCVNGSFVNGSIKLIACKISELKTEKLCVREREKERCYEKETELKKELNTEEGRRRRYR